MCSDSFLADYLTELVGAVRVCNHYVPCCVRACAVTLCVFSHTKHVLERFVFTDAMGANSTAQPVEISPPCVHAVHGALLASCFVALVSPGSGTGLS